MARRDPLMATSCAPCGVGTIRGNPGADGFLMSTTCRLSHDWTYAKPFATARLDGPGLESQRYPTASWTGSRGLETSNSRSAGTPESRTTATEPAMTQSVAIA